MADRISNPGPLTYESGVLPTALRGPAIPFLATPMGEDYVVIGFDMEIQPLVTHNAACPLCVSAVGIYVMSVHKLFAYRVVSTVSTNIVSSHTKYCRIAYGITR